MLIHPTYCGLSKNIAFLSAGHSTHLMSAGTAVLLVCCTSVARGTACASISHTLCGSGSPRSAGVPAHIPPLLGERLSCGGRVTGGAVRPPGPEAVSVCALPPPHAWGCTPAPHPATVSLGVTPRVARRVPAAGTMQSVCVLCLSPFALCLRVCVCGPRPCAAPAAAAAAPCPWLGRAGRPGGRRAGPRGGSGHRPPPNSPQRLPRRRRRGGSLARRGPAPSPPGAAPLRAACESGLCRARAAAAAGAGGQPPPRGSMEKAAGEGGGGSNSSSRSSSRPTSAGSSPSSSSASRGLPGRASAAGRLDGGGGGGSSPGSAAASPGGAQAPGSGGRRREPVLEGTLSKYTNLLQGWQSR